MSDYLKDLSEYNEHLNGVAKEIGFEFTPFPPAPVIGSSTYEKDVYTFLNAIPLLVKQVNQAAAEEEENS